jgi:hypothetical protein
VTPESKKLWFRLTCGTTTGTRSTSSGAKFVTFVTLEESSLETVICDGTFSEKIKIVILITYSVRLGEVRLGEVRLG